LIALIINAHPLGSGTDRAFMRKTRSCERAFFRNSSTGWSLIRKTSLSSDRSDGVRSSSRRKTLIRNRLARTFRHDDVVALQCSEIAHRSRLASRSTLGAILPLHDVRYQSVIARLHSLAALAQTRNCVRRTSVDLASADSKSSTTSFDSLSE
jgi:hypothetical protein